MQNWDVKSLGAIVRSSSFVSSGILAQTSGSSRRSALMWSSRPLQNGARLARSKAMRLRSLWMRAISARDAGQRRSIVPPVFLSVAAPDVVRDIEHQLQLAALVVPSDRLAAATAAGEAALRAQAQPVEIDIAGGLVDPALDLILAFQHRRLRADQTQHHGLALRQVAQRRELAGARGIELQKDHVDVGLVEQPLGDRLVAAFRHPGALEVAAAHVHADRHPGRPAGDRVVQQPDIARGKRVGVLAALLDAGADMLVAIARKRGVVDLQVAAATLAEFGDLLAIDAREIREELLDVG